MARKAAARNAEARRRQIAESTVRLLDKHGVAGTTTARIAESMGVSEATLYRYFDSRKDILLAALDVVFESIFSVIDSSHESDAIEQLREISRHHTALVSAANQDFVFPYFEFVAAPPELGLRQSFAARQDAAFNALSAIVDKGKAQGVIRPEIDSEQVAWELVGMYWSEDIAALIGLEKCLTAGRPAKELERILTSISADSAHPAVVEQAL